MDKMTAIEIIDMQSRDNTEIRIEDDKAVIKIGKDEINLKKLSPTPDYKAPKTVNEAKIIENKDIIYTENLILIRLLKMLLKHMNRPNQAFMPRKPLYNEKVIGW